VYCFHHVLGMRDNDYYTSVLRSKRDSSNYYRVMTQIPWYNGQRNVPVTPELQRYYQGRPVETGLLTCGAPSLDTSGNLSYAADSNVMRFVQEFGLEVIPKVHDKATFVTALREVLTRKTIRL